MTINFLPPRDDRVSEWYDLDEDLRVFYFKDSTTDPDRLQVEIIIEENLVLRERTDEGGLGAYNIVAEFVSDLVDEGLF